MMPSTDATLRALWARASTLTERLSGDFLPLAGAEEEAELRWAAWRSLAAEDDAQRMSRRLAFDGLEEAHVRPLLGAVVARAGTSLPMEFELLAEALSPAAPSSDVLLDELLSRMPFGDVLAPFLHVAQRRLDERLAGQPAAGVAALRLGCARGLGERLCEQAGPLLARLLEGERERRAEGCYRRLLDQATGSAAAAFWHSHAATARGLALAALHWVDASAEMLLRWQADAEALVQAFGPRAAGLPVELQTGLGDPHRGGRTVARLRFASGLDLFYKPRSLALDQAYAGLLAQLSGDDAPDGLRVDLQLPALLARADYGWVEGIAARAAADQAEVERYFERGGALLCLAHLLDITDCHSGNVIAVGDQPVLIDLETVCHQRARDLDENYSDAERRARQTIAASVLGCGLLPEARMEGELRVELGGLSPGPDAVLQTEVARWVDLGLDSMRREISQQAVGESAHQLMLDGAVVSVRDHGAALKRGFTRMACHAMARREAWCAPGGPLEAFAACEARFVFRGTLVYGALLNRLTAPDLAQEGVDRSLLLEALARPLLDADTPPPVWPLLAAERTAMEGLDVPHFHAPVAAAVLLADDGEPISGYLQEAGVARLRSRLMSFGEADLARELGFIDSALVRPLAAAAVPPAPATAPVDGASLRTAAMALVDRLEATAVWGDDGSATWMDALLDITHDCLSWRTLSPWLGDGVAGLALVLAALEQAATPAARPRIRRLRRGAQQQLALAMAQVAAQPLGGVTGAPSVAYALAQVAALTGDRSALEQAGRVVAAIPLEAIAADEVLDVVGGAAGTLLCLTTVRRIAEAAGEEALAAAATLRIRACAARLSWAGAEARGGLLPTVAGRVLTGLSHGQSGFALAIARLREEDGAAALQPMASAALAFEREHRDSEAGNWLDLRPGANEPCGCAWCHGAPGIGLVRAVLRAQADEANEALEEDLQMAARSTSTEPDAVLDHLCCGNLGLVACTQALAEALDSPALMANARERAGRVLARAQARGGFLTLLGAPAGQEALGLFTGLAGVSYALLRLAEPGLPSVLTLD